MNTPKWISWAGVTAILGGLIALLLTAPFAAAYYSAYPGFEVPPPWVQSLRPVLRPLLSFAPPVTVYNLYGRAFDLVYLLFLPAVFALHHLHRGTRSRIENWAFTLLVIGLLSSLIGVAIDYWAAVLPSPVIPFGFLEPLGLLILAVGATLYGTATLRSRILPRWCSWMLAGSLPAALIFTALIRHYPSGPTFSIAVSWLVIGYVLLYGKGITPRSPEHRRADVPV